MARQQDDDGVGIRRLHFFEHRKAVRIGEAVVEQHKIDALTPLFARFSGRLRLEDTTTTGARFSRGKPVPRAR